MKNKTGLWIDHKEAVIVELTEAGEQVRQLKSKVEKQRRRAGEPPNVSIAAGETPQDDSREREYQGHLARYYDEIISHLQTTDELLIFGPGEAKVELKKRLAKAANAPHTVSLATTDRLTTPQIAAHVREYFHHAAPRGRVPASTNPKSSTKVHYA